MLKESSSSVAFLRKSYHSVNLWDFLWKWRPYHYSSKCYLNRNICNIARGVERALLKSELWVGGSLYLFHSNLRTADRAIQPSLHPWEFSAAEASWWEGNWWNPVVLWDPVAKDLKSKLCTVRKKDLSLPGLTTTGIIYLVVAWSVRTSWDFPLQIPFHCRTCMAHLLTDWHKNWRKNNQKILTIHCPSVCIWLIINLSWLNKSGSFKKI